MKVVRKGYSPTTYHTQPECPYFPDEVREFTEHDARLRVRKCDACREIELGDLDLE